MKLKLLIGSLVVLASLPAHAALITSSFGGTVVDFSQFTACTSFIASQPACEPPEDVGTLVGRSIIFNGTSRAVARLYNANWALGTNGDWNNGRVGYAGLDNQTGDPNMFMSFTFDSPVSAVGAFMNYGNVGAPFIEALDSLGLVLESYSLLLAPIVTPDGLNDGGFRGIARAASDIWTFRIRGGLVPVADNLEFAAQQVSEPAILALLGIALAGLGFSRRKRIAN